MFPGWIRQPLACAFLAALGQGCIGTVPIEPSTVSAPIFSQIDARVGVYYTARARSAIAGQILHDAEIGKASVENFTQVFSTMFSEPIPLQDWPPWRHSDLAALDSVVELEDVDGSLSMGDGARYPDSVRVAYRICLYGVDLTTIGCWQVSSRQSHKRRMFECFPNAAPCLTEQFELAIRDAIAKFMVKFENDPGVENWVRTLDDRDNPR